jgi:hypothetical protein
MGRQGQGSSLLVVPSDRVNAVGTIDVVGSGSVSGSTGGRGKGKDKDNSSGSGQRSAGSGSGQRSAGSGSGQRSVGTGAGRTIVIGMSAAGSNNDDKAAQAGMDGFLVKPFRLDEMMGIITARTSGKSHIRGGSGNGHVAVSATVSGAVSGAAVSEGSASASFCL